MKKQRKIYYFDGYHGGQEGHMPLGAFRTILDLLDKRPEWKLSLDIEPESFKLLKFRDPQTFYRLKKKLNEKNPSVELVSEMYSQPLSCALNGEGIIRNFVYGRETLKESFDDICVENYFTQEPTFSSCFPQLLLSLGYKHASLFNSTTFAGYTKGINAPIVKWKGNDGSEIVAIPTYDINELVKHENNGSTWWSYYNLFASPEFVKDCYDAGIIPPSAMGLQDLGHNAEFTTEAKHDGIDRSYIEYVTPKQYFDITDDTDIPKISGQEIIRVSLPWSEKNLSGYLKEIRKYEYSLINAEILNFFAVLYENGDKEKEIRDCWKRFMLLSHHDVLVCTNHDFTRSMRYQLYALDNNFRDLKNDLKSLLISDETDEVTITIFNPTAKSVRRLVEADISLAGDIHSCKVFSNGVEIMADLFENEKESENSVPLDAESSMVNECRKRIAFYSDFKPFEFKEFTVKPEREKRSAVKPLLNCYDDKAVFENELVKIEVDFTRGGSISSYYDKKRRFEYVKKGGAFNELRGYFDGENRFVSSLEKRVNAVAKKNGENVAILRASIALGTSNAVIEYRFYRENAYIDVKTIVSCANGTKIGDPYKTNDWHDLHRTFYDIKYGLNAYFATSFEQKYIDKHCAFDICRSKDENTAYNNAKEIKHNVAVNWLDVTDENHGLAVFLKRTTSYTKEDAFETGISLLWGTDCSCIWNSELSGVTDTENYRVLPHERDCKDADIWGNSSAYNQDVCAFVGKKKLDFGVPFEIKTDCVELSAAFVEGNDSYIRLFNYGASRNVELELGQKILGLTPCSIDKKTVGEQILKDEFGKVKISMRKFQVSTFKLEIINK